MPKGVPKPGPVPGDPDYVRPTLPLRKRPRREQWHARMMLYDGRQFVKESTYDPEFHPVDMISYFQEGLGKVREPERCVNDKGDLKYVPRPARTPTIAGYAAKIGVSRETIYAWGQRYPEFQRAREICDAIYEAYMVEAGHFGALQPQIAMATLKNHLGWKEKAEVAHSGSVVLHFDRQDEDA